MSGVVQSFGALTHGQVAKAPNRASSLLRTAFRLVGMRAKYFPDGRFLPAREYMLAECNRHVAKSLEAKTVAGIVNVFLPCELLHAMGIHATFPEAMAVYFTASACEGAFIERAEKGGVPDSYCSYHKVLLGAAESGVIPRPRFIIHTTLACDANQLTFRRLEQHYGVPRLCIDVPNRADEESIAYVAGQLRQMGRFIGENTGTTLDEHALKESVARSRDTISNYRQYLMIRAEKTIEPDMTGEMLPLFGLQVLLGSQQALTYSRLLLRDIKVQPKAQKDRKRILWLHTLPNWQHGLEDIFVENRVELLGCDLAMSGLIDLDPEKPYESMARRVLCNSLNGPAARRIDNVLAYARQMGAHGIVFFNHWGCKGTLGASHLAKTTLEANGFPTLVLDGDGCDSGNVSNGQMSTRLQAFLEQLEGWV